MNPLETRKAITPLVGDRIARALATICEKHKTSAGFSVSVPSGVLVVIAEALALVTQRDVMAARLTGLQASVRAAIRAGEWKVDGSNDPEVYL